MLGFGVTAPQGVQAVVSVPPPSIMPLRTVVTQNRILSGDEFQSGKDRQCFRYPYVIACDCTELVVSNNAWCLSGTGEAAVANGFSVLEMSLEANGVIVPVLYNGLRSKSLASGDVDVQSDAVFPASFGLTEFAQGDVVWIKGIIAVSSAGQRIPYTVTKATDQSGGQAAWWDSGVATVSSTDVTGVYTISGGTFSSRATGYRPMVFGRPVTDGPSFVAVGDSIGESVNDDSYLMTTGTPIRLHGFGFIQRAMRLNDNSSLLPCLNLSRSASRSFDVSAGTRAKQFYKYARFGIDEYGTNNMPAAGTSLVALKSSLQVTWADMRAAGIEKIIRTKFLPRCDSTDSWTTIANQSYLSAWAPGASSDQMNLWFETELGAATIDYLVEMSGCRAVSDPLKWKTDTPEITTKFTAADNTHPSGRGHEFLAEELRPILRSLG